MPLLTRGASLQKHFSCFNICPQNRSEMGLFKNQISTLKLVSEAILFVTYSGFSELTTVKSFCGKCLEAEQQIWTKIISN